MKKAISEDKLQELLDSVEEEGKKLREILHDVVLYTDGAYNIKDLFVMPVYYIKEIMERVQAKNEKEAEQIEKAKGNNITRF